MLLSGEKDESNYEKWGIEGSTVQIYHSAWSVGEDYVLKEYFNQTTMQRNIQMKKYQCIAYISC